MLQLLWNMFEKTGQINAYMFYKALENSYQEDNKGEADLSDSINDNESDISAGMDA
ncbi:MAG TPA: YqzL family protein [Clostridiales bacterium]|nr:YqzL family protein [Clostridiales bacterium]